MLLQLDRQEDYQEDYTLSTQQAVDYLRARNPNIRITPDMFYHRVIRGRGIPHKEVTARKSKKRFFNKKDLDNVYFRNSAKQESLAERIALEIGGEAHYQDPIVVRTSSDLETLGRIYGPLVDDDELINEIEKITGYRYTRGAIKQRRIRKTILYVGYTDTYRRRYWYPVSQLKYIHFQPNVAAQQKRV